MADYQTKPVRTQTDHCSWVACTFGRSGTHQPHACTRAIVPKNINHAPKKTCNNHLSDISSTKSASQTKPGSFHAQRYISSAELVPSVIQFLPLSRRQYPATSLRKPQEPSNICPEVTLWALCPSAKRSYPMLPKRHALPYAIVIMHSAHTHVWLAPWKILRQDTRKKIGVPAFRHHVFGAIL